MKFENFHNLILLSIISALSILYIFYRVRIFNDYSPADIFLNTKYNHPSRRLQRLRNEGGNFDPIVAGVDGPVTRHHRKRRAEFGVDVGRPRMSGQINPGEVNQNEQSNQNFQNQNLNNGNMMMNRRNDNAQGNMNAGFGGRLRPIEENNQMSAKRQDNMPSAGSMNNLNSMSSSQVPMMNNARQQGDFPMTRKRNQAGLISKIAEEAAR
jgi:hypothetical protein